MLKHQKFIKMTLCIRKDHYIDELEKFLFLEI